MKRGDRPEPVWIVGLDETESELVRKALGEGFEVRCYPMDHLPERRDIDQAPTLVFMDEEAGFLLAPETARAILTIRDTRIALVISEESSDPESGFSEENGVFSVLRRPLEAASVRETAMKAVEVRNLYADIVDMTKEILLERELLTRKTDQLVFLNRVLSRATETLDPGVILARAAEDMHMLFPVSAVQAALWEPDEHGPLQCELYLCAAGPGPVRDAWVEHLLDGAARISGRPVADYTLRRVPCAANPLAKTVPPPTEPGRTVLLPLKVGRQTFGSLSITAGKLITLAKDQIQTIHSAVSHIALALRNAILFSRVKTRAEYDGLTRIHNRQSFDERIMEELKRHQRYGQDLGLLMLDLDHFKGVNDSYGHQAGDAVLAAAGRILSDTLRATDFPARYGGEEFVVILPQTRESEAWILAERLRRIIAAQKFNVGGHSFKVTASFGVTSVRPGPLDRTEDLVRKADQALYLAKAGGRNMVCTPAAEERRKVAEP